MDKYFKNPRKLRLLPQGKKGGVVSDLVSGTAGLVVLVIIALVVVVTLIDADLLSSDTTAKETAGNLSSNLSSGIDEVAKKIPTIFKVAVVVLLIAVLVILVQRARDTGFFGSGGGSL